MGMQTQDRPVLAMRVKTFSGAGNAVSAQLNRLIDELQSEHRWERGQIDVVSTSGGEVFATLHYVEITAVEVVDLRTGAVVRTETPSGLHVLSNV